MKAQLLAALILITGSALAAELPKWDKLTLKNGREYEKVTVTEKRPDGISISHDSGTARIRFEDLQEDAIALLGMSSEDAEAARVAAAQAVENGRKQAAIKSASLNFVGVVSQVLEDGLLVSNVNYKDGTRVEKKTPYKVRTGGPTGLNPKARYKKETRYKSEWTDREIFLGGPVFVRCAPGGHVDGDVFSKVVVPDGTYSYTNTLGAKKTVKAYTTDLKAAAR